MKLTGLFILDMAPINEKEISESKPVIDLERNGLCQSIRAQMSSVLTI